MSREEKEASLTADELKSILSYDPDTGIFRWKQARGSRAPAGSVAGGPHARGAHAIRINNRLHYAYRLAWLYMTGEWPRHQIDHINMDQNDTRFVNLREATHGQNQANRRKRAPKRGLRPTCTLKGVRRAAENRWYAYGNHKYIGAFDCPAAAHLAYVVAADRAYGQFARAA